MRSLTQFQLYEDTVFALDEDGILWCGIKKTVKVPVGLSIAFEWQAVAGPGDDDPFVDNRSKLDRLEEQLREIEREREILLGPEKVKTDTG